MKLLLKFKISSVKNNKEKKIKNSTHYLQKCNHNLGQMIMEKKLPGIMLIKDKNNKKKKLIIGIMKRIKRLEKNLIILPKRWMKLL